MKKNSCFTNITLLCTAALCTVTLFSCQQPVSPPDIPDETIKQTEKNNENDNIPSPETKLDTTAKETEATTPEEDEITFETEYVNPHYITAKTCDEALQYILKKNEIDYFGCTVQLKSEEERNKLRALKLTDIHHKLSGKTYLLTVSDTPKEDEISIGFIEKEDLGPYGMGEDIIPGKELPAGMRRTKYTLWRYIPLYGDYYYEFTEKLTIALDVPVNWVNRTNENCGVFDCLDEEYQMYRTMIYANGSVKTEKDTVLDIDIDKKSANLCRDFTTIPICEAGISASGNEYVLYTNCFYVRLNEEYTVIFKIHNAMDYTVIRQIIDSIQLIPNE